MVSIKPLSHSALWLLLPDALLLIAAIAAKQIPPTAFAALAFGGRPFSLGAGQPSVQTLNGHRLENF